MDEGRRQKAGGRTLKSTQTVCPKQVKHVHVWLLDQSPCNKRWVRNEDADGAPYYGDLFKFPVQCPLVIV